MLSLDELKNVVLGSLGNLLLASLVIVVTIITAKIVKALIKRYFATSSKYIKVDPTNYRFLRHFIVAIIYLIGLGIAVYIIPPMRSLSVSLLAGAGVIAIVIGFASQQALANIISGILIVIFKPFRVDDRIKIGEISGTVEDINLRHTVVRTFENKRVVIPNSVISNEKIENANLKEDKICRFVDFSISYDSNIDKAMKILQQEATKHKLMVDNRSKEMKKNNEPIVTVRVIGFADSSVNIRAYVWANSPTESFILGTDLNKSVKERFDKEGIEIPYPYRTIVYKKDLQSPRKK